jgi:glycosyltransferase involved in cell wall biosynthesis
MKRILFLVQSSKYSGAETVLFNIINRISGDNCFDLMVFLPRENFIMKEKLEVINQPIYTSHVKGVFDIKSKLFKILVLAIQFFELFWLCFRKKFDYLYANSVLISVPAFLLSLFFDVTVLVHIHDILKESLINRIILSIISKRVKTYIAVSYAVRESVENLRVPLDKIVVIHNGIFLDNVDVATTWRGKEKARNTVAIIGQITKWKGQHIFLQAANLVVKEISNVEFWIVGAPLFGEYSYLEELKQMARNFSLEDHVKFKGYIKDINKVYNAIDILVICSDHEPFGLTAVEAMSHGIPVIAPKCGGVMEIVQNEVTGLLYQFGDEVGLKNALIRIIKNPDLAMTLGQNGIKRVAERFDFETQIQKIYSVLEIDRTCSP